MRLIGKPLTLLKTCVIIAQSEAHFEHWQDMYSPEQDSVIAYFGRISLQTDTMVFVSGSLVSDGPLYPNAYGFITVLCASEKR